jgi:Ca2+-transporting ATPase
MKKPPRKHDEGIISGWIFVRYMIIGLYVGLATVGIFVYWYTSYSWAGDGHQLISYRQLSNWSECQNWSGFTVKGFGVYDFSGNPCDYFKWGKQTASTLSLSVLVMIEMLNALNALSEDSSILSMGLTCNPWLLLAILGSMLFHCLILYIPLFS